MKRKCDCDTDCGHDVNVHPGQETAKISKMACVLRDTAHIRPNSCDHGHQTSQEVRLLPLGAGGNVIICLDHFCDEITFRRERNRNLDKECQFDLPAWEDLVIYDPA